MNPLLQILTNLANTTERFLPSFKSRQDFEALMFRYGWLVDLEETSFGTVTAIQNISSAIEGLSSSIQILIEEELENETERSTEEWIQLIDELKGILKGIYNLILDLKNLDGSKLTSLGVLDNPKARDDFKKELPERLIEDIFTLTLQRHYPIAYGFLHLFGIIEYTEEEPAGEYRVNYTRTNIDWSRFGDFIKNPVDLLQNVYSWDKTINYDDDTDFEPEDFQWEKLLHTLERTFLANRFLARYILPRRSVVEGFGMNPEWVFGHELHELQIPFIYGTSILDESFYNIGLGIMPIGSSDAAGTKPDGILITPILQGGLTHSFFITPEISLKLETAANLNDAVAVKISPNDISFSTDFPDIGVSSSLVGSPYEPWIILGSADSHRLEIHGFELGMSMSRVGEDKEVKLWFKATSPNPEERGVQAVIDLGGADSFMKKTSESDAENIEMGFDLEIEWSSKTGFKFGGGAKLEYQAALNLSLGLLEVTNLYVSLGADASDDEGVAVQFRTGLGLKGELGPVRFFVENMGFSLDMITHSADKIETDNAPALGMMGFDFGFAPPKGIGIVIDAPMIKGGGYLEFDKPRYIGAAELTISDLFSIKAIAIIDTELPDGKEGYSFLLLVTVEFNPIQLSFGFTLNGVGGLVGIHRSMSIDAIQEKVKTGEFDKVLFPEEPIGNIKSIVASLDAIFPIQEDQYAFGIMLKLGWGTPTLIHIKVGLLIQLPKFKLVLLGTVRAELSRKSAGGEAQVLIKIQLSFAAWYDSDRKLFGFDASLYESKIIGINIQGDAAIRIRGGDDPYFMMSIGGFHPDFEPPQGLGLGELKRIEIFLKPESFDIDLSGKFYNTITSNTVQLGASIDARLSFSSFLIEGGIGFDALFQFSPLYFRIDVWGYVTISIWDSSWGLRIDGSVEGPNPFKFNLSVTLDLGWWGSYTKAIPEFTIGEKAIEERPKIDVFEELRIVLEDNRNWIPVLPERSELLVSLRGTTAEFSKPEEEEKELELTFHPLGGVKIDQNRVPLGIPIEKFGHNEPESHNYFSIVLKYENEAIPVKQVTQFFPPAQFYELTQKQKLDRPSYEKMGSGIQIQGFDQIEIGERILSKQVEFETGYYDPKSPLSSPAKEKDSPLEKATFDIWTKNTSIEKSALGKKNTHRAGYEFIRQEIENEYMIIHQGGDPSFEEKTYKSKTAAQIKLQHLMNENPELEDDLVVVPVFETV